MTANIWTNLIRGALDFDRVPFSADPKPGQPSSRTLLVRPSRLGREVFDGSELCGRFRIFRLETDSREPAGRQKVGGRQTQPLRRRRKRANLQTPVRRKLGGELDLSWNRLVLYDP